MTGRDAGTVLLVVVRFPQRNTRVLRLGPQRRPPAAGRAAGCPPPGSYSHKLAHTGTHASMRRRAADTHILVCCCSSTSPPQQARKPVNECRFRLFCTPFSFTHQVYLFVCVCVCDTARVHVPPRRLLTLLSSAMAVQLQRRPDVNTKPHVIATLAFFYVTVCSSFFHFTV